MAVMELARRSLHTDLRTEPVFSNPQAVKDFLQMQLGHRPHEVFGVLFLDAQHRLIAFEELFRGTLTQTSVYPREVVLRALHHQAAAVVLAHNHPSGSVQPSRADEALTQTLTAALALLDVRVLDHIIVAPGQALSMAERANIADPGARGDMNAAAQMMAAPQAVMQQMRKPRLETLIELEQMPNGAVANASIIKTSGGLFNFLSGEWPEWVYPITCM